LGAILRDRYRAKTGPHERIKETVMRKFGTRGIVLSVLAAGLLTTGCVSRADVEKAQATADSALSTAQQAGQAAQQAQQAASAAQQTADQARNEVTALSQKVDTLVQMHAARGPRD
jgi:outer membrane murein-binding lipoprotein Lpp